MYESMTSDELQTILNDKDGQRRTLRAEMKEIKEIMDARILREKTAAKVSKMSDAEKEALVQEIRAPLVDSTSEVHGLAE